MNKIIFILSLSFLLTACVNQGKPTSEIYGKEIGSNPFEMNRINLSQEVNNLLQAETKYISPPEIIPDKVPTTLAPDIFIGSDPDSLRWNESGQISAFTKTDQNSKKMTLYTYNFKTKKLVAIDSITPTRLTEDPNSPVTGNIFVEKFSPSGVYIEYKKGGYEACIGFVANAETSIKLSWDLMGCPKIVWSTDGKQVLVGRSEGMFGEAYLLKSVLGNIQQLVPVVSDLEGFKKRFGITLNASSIIDFYFAKGSLQQSIIFRIEKNAYTFEKGNEIRTFSVSEDGKVEEEF